MNEEHIEEVDRLVTQISLILAGRNPALQGATLAVLLAMWLDGHHPKAMRGELFAEHVQAVANLAALHIAVARISPAPPTGEAPN